MDINKLYKNPPKSFDEVVDLVVKVIKEEHYAINCSGDFLDVFDLEDYLNAVDYPWKSDNVSEPGMCPHEDTEVWDDHYEHLNDMDEQEMIKIIMKAKDIVDV